MHQHPLPSEGGWCPRKCVALRAAIPRELPGGALLAKRHRHDLRERDFLRIAVRRHPNGHRLLWDIELARPVQIVWKGENSRPVGICFLADHGMVNAMHAWCHDKAAQPALDIQGDLDIRVMKENR